MPRCHLCGRDGTRGYVYATVRQLERWGGVVSDAPLEPDTSVPICAAARACNRRRKVTP